MVNTITVVQALLRAMRPVAVALVLAGVALPLIATTAPAQSLEQQTVMREGPLNVISANPFLPLFGYFSGEYERSVTNAISVTLATSHIKPVNEVTYTNFDLKVRMYPAERGLEGFNFAASLGTARIKDGEGRFDCATPELGCPIRPAFNAGAFAIELGYQWLLGPSKVMAVSIGGGAKRYIGSSDNFQSIERVLPTLRLNVGYAF